MGHSTAAVIRQQVASLPGSVVRALQRRLGSAAQPWLDEELPRIVSRCLNEWELTWEVPLSGGSTAVVIGVRDRDSKPAILKVRPEPWRADHELLGYRRWGGRTLPRLLRQAPDVGALLLERVTPQDVSARHPGC